MRTSRERLPLIVMTVTTVLWSLNYFSAKHLYQFYDPFTVTWGRIFLATAVFALLMPGRFRRIFRWSVFLDVLPMALSGILANLVLFNLGLYRTSVTHSALITSAIPVFVLILARVFLRESLTVLRISGILIAFGGMAVVTRGGLGHSGHGQWIGDLITLSSSLAFAIYTILGRRRVGAMDPLDVIIACYSWSAVLILPVVIFHHQSPLPMPQTFPDWFHLGYIVLMGTVTTYSLHCWSLSRLESSKVAVFTPVQPVLTTAVACMLFGEVFTPELGIGGVLVIAGVILTQKG